MNLLIIYGTTEGHTRKVCIFLKNTAERKNNYVHMCNASAHPPEPGTYDRVIVAASMHVSGYQESIKNYIKEHAESLNQVPSAFLSVSLTAAGNEENSWKELKELTARFLFNCGWEPRYIHYVAGALMYSRYNLLKRFVMRLIAKKAGQDTNTDQDYIYTNWKQLELFLDKLLLVKTYKDE